MAFKKTPGSKRSIGELAAASLLTEISDQSLDQSAAAGSFTAGDDCFQPLSQVYGLKAAVCTAGVECGAGSQGAPRA